jgi:SAM-dependent methyltransferase
VIVSRLGFSSPDTQPARSARAKHASRALHGARYTAKAPVLFADNDSAARVRVFWAPDVHGRPREWDRRYRTEGPESTTPSDFLVSLDDVLPRAGRALDVAGGAGRNAIWLARRGLAVTVVDISQAGLDLARAAAAEAGVALELIAADSRRSRCRPALRRRPRPSTFCRRPLFAAFPAVMAPGALLVYRQPTRSNLTATRRPPAGFLLDDGELPHLVRAWRSSATKRAGSPAARTAPATKPASSPAVID